MSIRFCFFFSSRRRHTRCSRDWSSDVCSSDLVGNYPVPPLGAILVLLWVQWSRTPWHDIGFVRPKSWTRDLAVGLACGVAFKLLMKALVMPLLGAPPIKIGRASCRERV